MTYKNAADLRAVAALVPPDRLLVETDAPFLSPGILRGRRNEPANVALTLRALALCRGVAPADLARQIQANARTVFAW
jgi:TatD DNase family protein